jgi:hypothetical protein
VAVAFCVGGVALTPPALAAEPINVEPLPVQHEFEGPPASLVFDDERATLVMIFAGESATEVWELSSAAVSWSLAMSTPTIEDPRGAIASGLFGHGANYPGDGIALICNPRQLIPGWSDPYEWALCVWDGATWSVARDSESFPVTLSGEDQILDVTTEYHPGSNEVAFCWASTGVQFGQGRCAAYDVSSSTVDNQPMAEITPREGELMLDAQGDLLSYGGRAVGPSDPDGFEVITVSPNYRREADGQWVQLADDTPWLVGPAVWAPSLQTTVLLSIHSYPRSWSWYTRNDPPDPVRDYAVHVGTAGEWERVTSLGDLAVRAATYDPNFAGVVFAATSTPTSGKQETSLYLIRSAAADGPGGPQAGEDGSGSSGCECRTTAPTAGWRGSDPPFGTFAIWAAVAFVRLRRRSDANRPGIRGLCSPSPRSPRDASRGQGPVWQRPEPARVKTK